MQFGTGYYMPMDREYKTHTAPVNSPSSNSTNDVGVNVGDFGLSVGLGPVPNVQALQAKMRPGSRKVELSFMGAGKGSGQAHTPEMYGEKQRKAMEEMGAANRIDFTTHASVGVYGLAGMDQQGNFSKQSKNMSVQEIKRAIEFAADVGKGGPVVVHTGEFQRPISDSEWNKENDPWKDKFEMYPDEEERTSYKVVDTRTGKLIQEAQKNRKVARPIWNYAKEGEEYRDYDGTKRTVAYIDEKGVARDERNMPVYVDYFGERLHPESRVPEFDAKKQRFKVQQMTWEDLEQEAIDMTQRAKDMWLDWKSGKINEEEFMKSRWGRFKAAKDEKDIKVRPEEAYIISTLETSAANSRGYAHYYGGSFDDYVDQMKKLKEALELYKKIEEEIDPNEKWRLKERVRELRVPEHIVPPEAKFPTDLIKEAIRDVDRQMKYSQDSSASQWAQAEEAEETIRNVESADTYAFNEACDAYAESAIKALEQTKQLKKMGKMKKPVAVAMENLFPETYGSHPDELIHLVKGSRERFQQMLTKRGMSEEEAKKAAEDHLTTTFDIGHLNMWRKYWKGDPKKSVEQNDEEFNKWVLDKVEKMVDTNIIGHVHLTDNYGYQDDHLAPGEGNAPIRRMVKLLKDKGYKGDIIVEPGADYNTDVSGFHTMMKTWRHFGSPVYGVGSGIAPSARSWEQVGYGWFGQNQPPYFTFGGYSPSEDWTFWSGVPLE